MVYITNNLMRFSAQAYSLCSLALLLFLLSPTHALSAEDVMFEGYYSIKAGNTSIGYAIQRFTFDKKKKQFSSAYYVRTNEIGGNQRESLRAVSNDKFEPISYQYTSQVGKKIKTIDAKFKNRKMTAIVSDGKRANTIEKKLPKGTFMSVFLGYLMLSKGVSKGKKFNYNAIAEEDAEIYSGEAFVEDELTYMNVKGYRVQNKFKNVGFYSYMSQKAEVLGTTSPVQGLTTQLARRASEATAGLKVNAKELKLIFGRVPRGLKNPLAKATSTTQYAKPKKPSLPAGRSKLPKGSTGM